MRPHTLPGDRKEMTSQKPMPLFPNSRVESRELEVQRSDFERQRGPMSRNMQAKFSGPAEKDIERQSMGRRDWMEDRPKKIGSQDISLEQSHLQQDMQLFRQVLIFTLLIFYRTDTFLLTLQPIQFLIF